MEYLIKQLFEASETKQMLCRILFGARGFTQSRAFVWCMSKYSWQSAGFSKRGQAEYRNLSLEKIIEVELTNEKFSIKKGFNSNDTQYKDWVYHI